MNAFAERFNRTLQEEATFPLFSEPIEVWNRFLSHYLMQYNFFRPHHSLEYKTPIEHSWEKKKSPIVDPYIGSTKSFKKAQQ